MSSLPGERIAKVLARAGLCSRREAERWIAEGRVEVDGRVLTTPAVTVGPDSVVRVDGQPLPDVEETRLWRYHKPAGKLTTHNDPQDRPTVFQALPADMPRVVSVGRLDFNSEGLILLTSNGDIVNAVLRAEHKLEKEKLSKLKKAEERQQKEKLAAATKSGKGLSKRIKNVIELYQPNH